MMTKSIKLTNFFMENRKVALAFSGGTDSSLLLSYGKQANCDIRPYFVKAAFQPEFELDDAKRLCEELGIGLSVIELDIFTCEEVIKNPKNRCYFCKQQIFSNLIERAKKDGYSTIIDGTNASDDSADRPGMLALKELSVLSPLKECGISKDEVRALSRQAGLFTADKPSYACLATRIPTGTKITGIALEAAENSEKRLLELGFSNLRVRVLGNMAKLQVPKEQFDKAIGMNDQIVDALSEYFTDVVLDLKPR